MKSEDASVQRAMMRAMDAAIEEVRSFDYEPTAFLMSPAAIQILSGGTSRRRIGAYRNVDILENDSWSWGWMLKASDGEFYPR